MPARKNGAVPAGFYPYTNGVDCTNVGSFAVKPRYNDPWRTRQATGRLHYAGYSGLAEAVVLKLA